MSAWAVFKLIAMIVGFIAVAWSLLAELLRPIMVLRVPPIIQVIDLAAVTIFLVYMIERTISNL